MFKHAYLIIAHRNPNQLYLLISLLDDIRNDIYIMIDKKSSCFDMSILKRIARKSNVYFTRQLDIHWGGYSLIESELCLLEEATKNEKYMYYHLLSGQDLPLYSQDDIHNFFEMHSGYEFLTYVGDAIFAKNAPIDRVKYFYPFMDSGFPFISGLLLKIQRRLIIPLQKLLRVNRLREANVNICYGSQWFSITDDFARLILRNKMFIKKTFSYGFCVDELFIHTLAERSCFCKKIFIREGINDKKSDRQGNLRYINWWAGNPKTWTYEDKEELLEARNRGYLFSRKFDEKVDKEIIQFIYNLIRSSDLLDSDSQRYSEFDTRIKGSF